MRSCVPKSLVSAFLGCALMAGPVARTAAADDSGSAAAKVPKIVRFGLDAYKNGGPDDAVNAWLQGSVLSGSKEALDAANLLRQVHTVYGAYLGFDVISVRDLTPSTRVLYLALDYDRGPVFARFVVYRAKPGWVVTDFVFDQKEDLVLPVLP